jgi:hypothetical protein
MAYTKEKINEVHNILTNKGPNDYVKTVREWLYKFSYENLDKKNKNTLDLLNKILSFFYTGDFGENSTIPKDVIDQIKNDLELEIENDQKKEQENVSNENLNKEEVNLESQIKSFDKEQYIHIKNKWNFVKRKLKCLPKFNGCSQIDLIVVYEAPPFNNTEVNYFLSNLNKQGQGLGKGNYAFAIKSCFNNEGGNIVDIMKDNRVGFFDLLMAPLPLSRDIRKKWGDDAKWMIDGKPLTVVLFELGIAHLIIEGNNFNKNPLFAIGTPPLTSASIFEYYSDKPLEVWKKVNTNNSNITLDDIHFGAKPSYDYELVFSTNLSTTNSPTTHKFNKDKWKGIIFPLFKANISSGSNYPSATLMKNAFNKFD